MQNLKLTATQKDEHNKSLNITSSFLKGNIEGDYSYRTLPASVLNIMRKYVPALILPARKTIETENNFYFDLHLFDTELLSTVFQIPLKLYTHSTLKGYFNDKAQRIRIEGYFPRFRYEDKFFESGMILCETQATSSTPESGLPIVSLPARSICLSTPKPKTIVYKLF